MKRVNPVNVILLIVSLIFLIPSLAAAFVVEQEGGKTYIVDRYNEKWDVTEAKTLGFKPRNFQYGIGRHAFQTLEDSSLSDNHFFMSSTERVIGIEDSIGGKAFSVKKLRNHEIANTWQDEEPVTVGY
jgi:hypothetical protein